MVEKKNRFVFRARSAKGGPKLIGDKGRRGYATLIVEKTVRRRNRVTVIFVSGTMPIVTAASRHQLNLRSTAPAKLGGFPGRHSAELLDGIDRRVANGGKCLSRGLVVGIDPVD